MQREPRRTLATQLAAIGFALMAAVHAGPNGNAQAAVPTLGGLMNHVNVSIEPAIDPTPGDPPFRFVAQIDNFTPQGEALVPPTETFDAPFDVLNGKAYNAQYGWLRSGRWGVPAGQTMYLEQIDGSIGLETYAGGLGFDAGGTGNVDGTHALDPIFGTQGSDTRWAWGTADTGLSMTHHWIATQTPGPHFATYALYVEDDATGQPSAFYQPGLITLRWTNPLPQLAGDFNASGSVEQGDLDLVLGNWGQDASTNLPTGWLGTPPSGDINQDELDAVLTGWGSGPSPDLKSQNLPEPNATLALTFAFVTLRVRLRHAPSPQLQPERQS